MLGKYGSVWKFGRKPLNVPVSHGFPTKNVHFGSDTVTGTVKTCKNCELGQTPVPGFTVAEKGALWLALHGFILSHAMRFLKWESPLVLMMIYVYLCLSMFIYVYLCLSMFIYVLWLFYRLSDLFGGDPESTSEIFKYPKPLKLLKKWGKGVTWQLLIQWQLGVLIIRGLSILCTIWVGESLGEAEFVHAGMKHDTYQQLVSTP